MIVKPGDEIQLKQPKTFYRSLFSADNNILSKTIIIDKDEIAVVSDTIKRDNFMWVKVLFEETSCYTDVIDTNHFHEYFDKV